MSFNRSTRQILLADDDKDDSILFQDVLDELPLSTHLTTVSNGEQLMPLLNDTKKTLPDILFLDLTLPGKNGFDCLLGIKFSDKLKLLPIVIFSTSFEQEVVSLLYKNMHNITYENPMSTGSSKNLFTMHLVLQRKPTIYIHQGRNLYYPNNLSDNDK